MPGPKKVDAAYERIEAAESTLFQFEPLVDTGITAMLTDWEDDSSYRPVAAVAQILTDLRCEATKTWRARRSCESAIGVIFEREFRALDLAVGVSQECTRRLTNRGPYLVPEPVAYSVSSLGVRAQSTTHEITALLRAALVNGALGRWRTLHEVEVVTKVLSVGNRYTAGRYNNHRWITMAIDLDHPAPGVKWPTGLTEPAIMRDRLVKRYGKPYKGRYGWASSVTKKHLKVEHPMWHHLERVAELSDSHQRHVRSAHHSVHADSLGTLNLIDSSGSLHSGAGLDGIPELSWRTIRTLRETTGRLIAIWERYDNSPEVRASRELAEEAFFQAELMVIESHESREAHDSPL